MKQEYDGLKRGNSGLRVTRSEKMRVHVTRKDLLDAFAAFLTQKHIENNMDLRMRRDDSNEKYTEPSSYHLLRVRKSYPNINQALDSRMRRDDPNKKYAAPPSYHMLRVRKAYPSINHAMGFRVTRGDKRELPYVYGRI